MNTLRNKVSLIGTVSGNFTTINSVLQFNLTTLELINHGNDQSSYKHVDHVIQVSGRMIQRIQLIDPGQELIVEGRLNTTNYRDEKNNAKFGTVIELNEFLILTPKRKNT
jgi:single-stranded DNA-binding protein